MEEWVLTALRDHVKGEILTDDAARSSASTDASAFCVMPAAVAIPRGDDDLMRLVKNVRSLHEQGVEVSLAPRGAGTCMSGGSLTEGVSVDMRPGFNWIADVDRKERSVWVGAGTYYRDVEAALAPKKLMFAPYTSSKDLCTIGGMVGNNASGEKSIRFGATVDNVMALRMVCADGNMYEFGSIGADEFARKVELDTFEGHLYRELDKLIEDNWDTLQHARPKVRKNAAGYQLWRVINKDQNDFNLAKLIVGAQGTLGIVTAVKLRLVERLLHRRMLIVPINEQSELADAIHTILLHHPESLETYDHHTYERAELYMPEAAQLAHVSRGHELVLMAQFNEPTKDQTDHYAEVCQRALERKKFTVHFVDTNNEAEAHWQIRRASTALLIQHPPLNTRAVPCIEDIIVSVEHYGEFLAAWEAILSDYKMTYTVAGHIGDGSIRLIPMVNMETPDAVENIIELSRRSYDLALAFGGSISADHNDGLMRTPFLPAMYDYEVLQLFQEVKDLFDPQRIFNPGKKVEGSLAYSIAHMIKANKR